MVYQGHFPNRVVFLKVVVKAQSSSTCILQISLAVFKELHIYADDCKLHLSYEPKEAVQAIDKMNSDLQSNTT